MKNTLIVPCAGKSTRFPNMRPKWMLYHPDGKMMIEKAIEGLNLDEFDEIIFTIVKEHAEKFEAQKILDEIFHFKKNSRFKLCILEDFTSCQAETVYQTLEKCSINNKFSVKDSDNYINMQMSDYGDYITGININTFSKEIRRLSGKSFLIINEQSIITDIIEKKIKSEHICVGMYGFSDAGLFKEAYMHLSDVSDKKYEIYLSHIISYLIGTKKSVYRYIEAKGYEDWGTIQDWNIVLQEKKTIVINMDGILFEEKEHYGNNNWNTPLIPIQENTEKIKLLIANGAQVIILTSMSDEYKEIVEEALRNEGIKSYKVVTGCYMSHETLIKKSDRAIPYPGCDSINVSKGNTLKEYL